MKLFFLELGRVFTLYLIVLSFLASIGISFGLGAFLTVHLYYTP